MSLRRFRLRFREPVDIKPLVGVEGVSLVGQESDIDVTLQVEGEVDRLIKALAPSL